MTVPLNQYAPQNGRFVDDNGRLTAAAQIWLRGLFLRAGGTSGTSVTQEVLSQQFMLAGDSDDSSDVILPGPPGPQGPQGVPGPMFWMQGEDGEPGIQGPPGVDGNSSIVLVAVLAADESTAADTNPVSLTDLAWNFEADSVYSFKFIGNVSPATATTGCGFQLLVT